MAKPIPFEQRICENCKASLKVLNGYECRLNPPTAEGFPQVERDTFCLRWQEK